MNLSQRQLRFLRQQAHSLKPVMTTGDKGISPAFLQELDATLEHHELLKIRVRDHDRASRDQAIESIASAMRAQLVGRIGNVATLFRQRRKNSRFTLPLPG